MGENRPPAQFLREAGLVVLPGTIRPREGQAWLVAWRGTRGVLRRSPRPPGSRTLARLHEDATWLHGFLARLAGLGGLGFAAPRPLPVFAGSSWSTAHGAFWEVTSYLPGRTVDWAEQPPMAEIGALLGRYHLAAAAIGATSQRPSALPLARVTPILLSPRLTAARLGVERTALIRQLADQLARDLEESAHLRRPPLVIHGDFTNHNVTADGAPPRAAGVIDFALAHAETPPADIGYGLWRSGRPCQDATRLDLARVRSFVAGYASAAPLSADEASVVPMYLRGRGLQMIAKRIRAGRAETGMLTQVRWLAANNGPLTEAIVAALA